MENEYRKKDNKGREKMVSEFGKAYIMYFTPEQTNPVDFYLTARTHSEKTYVGDVKAYIDTEHPREYSKFIKNEKDYGYMIDLNKLREIKKIAMNQGRTPILLAYFTDFTIIWNLNNMPWETRCEWRYVNKDGCHYGEEKEWELMTYLYKKEAVYAKPTK